MYEFIDGEKANFPIICMCRWARVSRAGFYEWRDRPDSATTERRRVLQVLIVEIFERSRGTYGYRRVHEELQRRQVPAGPELVRALMAVEGLVACQPRPWRVTTEQGDGGCPDDVLQRDFTAEEPGVRFVGDITYVATWQGWLFLATVIDLCTRQVVGWAMADHLRTSLVCDAISMAKRNHPIRVGAVFHSDRGCQYTSGEFKAHLTLNSMVGSMGRTGVCWDNALAESFFASL